MTGQKHIYTLQTLVGMTRDLHSAGCRIGITHGAFDLFHASHLDLLKKSAKLCDFLIVGVESDEHVVAYKTYKRPIISSRDRMAIVNEIHCVDAVFLNDSLPFDSESFTRIYRLINADIVTIGQQFTYNERMVAQTKNAGAELHEIHTVQHATTTTIIESIIEKYH